MSMVRVVDRNGRSITVDVVGTLSTSDAAGQLADFMREDVYFTGQTHPHNDAVRTLLQDERAAAAAKLEEAQAALWQFQRRHGL